MAGEAGPAIVSLHGFAEFLVEFGVPFGVLQANAAMAALAVMAFVVCCRLGGRGGNLGVSAAKDDFLARTSGVSSRPTLERAGQ